MSSLRGPSALIALAIASVSAVLAPMPATNEAVAAERTNVVLILADDMNDYDLDYMPLTRQLLGAQGTEFTDFLSPHPLCCPARAELLTGQYAHNNGVHDNGGEYGQRGLRDGANNVGRWLRKAGYRTAIVGKFLNGFGPAMTRSLPGWNVFNIATRCVLCSHGTTYWNDGRPITSDQYTTNYVRDRTVDYIRRFSGRGFPFFIHANVVAPHNMKPGRDVRALGPPIPAPRDSGTMTHIPAPFVDKPSFNEGDVSDKPSHWQRAFVDRSTMVSQFHRRIESLQAVDRMVRAIVRALSATGQLDNTAIIFTSDNGYLLGEHRLDKKNFPYEEDIQAPLLVRGPGVPAGASVEETMSLVDIPATIAEFAGATPERMQDGRSMLPVIAGALGYETSLIQAGSAAGPWSWRGVRDGNWTYVEHVSGERELYDRTSDPFQLENVYGTKPVVEVRLQAELERLKTCAGTVCQ